MSSSNAASDTLNKSKLDSLMLFEEHLAEFLKGIKKVEPLAAAIKYMLLSGGKRVRPLLGVAILNDLAMDFRSFLPAALALEMLHTSSLVHDDLPALDNDNYRRGKNTCHVEFNEATAILCGDILLTFAIEHISAMKASAEIKFATCNKLSLAYRDLCYGQQLDLNENKSAEQILETARLKTGALFSACTSLPFIFASSGDRVVSLAEEIGVALGVCYQICDDYADQDERSLKLVNLAGSDRKDGKETFYLGKNKISADEILWMNVQKIKQGFDDIRAELKIKSFDVTLAYLNRIFSGFKGVQVIF